MDRCVCGICNGCNFAKQKSRVLWQRAEQARENNENLKAAKLYQCLLEVAPENWEAAFFSVLCRSSYGSVAMIELSCEAVCNCLDHVFLLVKRIPEEKQKDAIQTVMQNTTAFASSMFEAAIKHHMSIDDSVRIRFREDLRRRLTAACLVMVSCAESFVERFGRDSTLAWLLRIPAKELWKALHRQFLVAVDLQPESLEKMMGYLKKYDPFYWKRHRNRKYGAVIAAISLVLGWGSFAVGLALKGGFLAWLCLLLAAFCLLLGAALLLCRRRKTEDFSSAAQ